MTFTSIFHFQFQSECEGDENQKQKQQQQQKLVDREEKTAEDDEDKKEEEEGHDGEESSPSDYEFSLREENIRLKSRLEQVGLLVAIKPLSSSHFLENLLLLRLKFFSF